MPDPSLLTLELLERFVATRQPPAVPAVAETAEKPPETKKPVHWATEEDRRIFLQAGAPDNPSAEQLRQAHAVHYEEPPPASAPVERLTREEFKEAAMELLNERVPRLWLLARLLAAAERGVVVDERAAT